MRQLDVGGVREVDVLGLARIDLPGDLAVGRHVGVDEALLLGGCAHGLRVTAGAFVQRRDAGEGAVVAERVAILAFGAGLIGMDLVTEIDRLRHALEPDHGKAAPAHGQGRQHAGKKEDRPAMFLKSHSHTQVRSPKEFVEQAQRLFAVEMLEHVRAKTPPSFIRRRAVACEFQHSARKADMRPISRSIQGTMASPRISPAVTGGWPGNCDALKEPAHAVRVGGELGRDWRADTGWTR